MTPASGREGWRETAILTLKDIESIGRMMGWDEIDVWAVWLLARRCQRDNGPSAIGSPQQPA